MQEPRDENGKKVQCPNCQKETVINDKGRCSACGTNLRSEFAHHTGARITLGAAEK
ncbi:hypothetical protein GYA13_02555 [Candidatus Kuenenbacteria bacterium]|nr:hypothetical protein [Candidatus Kuenenbacteria bacterium]